MPLSEKEARSPCCTRSNRSSGEDNPARGGTDGTEAILFPPADAGSKPDIESECTSYGGLNVSSGQGIELEVVDSLVCHMEYTTCQSLHPLQSNGSRAAEGGIPLDSKHSLDVSQDEAWAWQSSPPATFCCSGYERSHDQQVIEVAAQS